MSSKIIGAEIGNDTIKLAVCKGGRVTTLAAERLPEGMMRDGRVTAPEAMAALIKEACKRHGIRRGDCALVLPSKLVIGRKVTMPAMNEAELKLNLPFEFRDFVGKDGGKYTYDYSMIGVKDNVMQLYAAAALTEAVEEYASIFHKAGLTLKAAVPEEMAWLNLICRATNEPKKLCIVDIGALRTRVSIFSDGRYEMGREIDIGGQAFDAAISAAEDVDVHVARTHKEANLKDILSSPVCIDLFSELSIEVMKVVNFYFSSTQDGNSLQDLYFCGGSAQMEPLRIAIQKRTDFNMHHVRRLVNADGIDDDTVLYCALAAGAAMQMQ